MNVQHYAVPFSNQKVGENRIRQHHPSDSASRDPRMGEGMGVKPLSNQTEKPFSQAGTRNIFMKKYQ